MVEDRLIQALQRLVHAVTHLEQVQAMLPAPQPTIDEEEEERLRARIDQLAAHNAALDDQHRTLQERHERLRASAAEAAMRLGELIG
jgi:predicted  nucleic acid-binding Zn-ribbon protein